MTAMLFTVGCKKDKIESNDGGGSNGGGGNGTFNGHAYVDLGLPSGTLWATCNVGATTPEGYGDYFAWGETESKTTNNWITYKYANYTSCSGPQLTKYCNYSSFGYNGFTDTLTILLPEDDAATANWGDGWRMPTMDQWRELRDNTNVAWTTRNGVYGRLYTANNSNTLFLPAAGYYRFEGSLYDAGSCGAFWSSSLYAGNSYYAWVFYFDSDNCHLNHKIRYQGLSVRPVRSARQK